MFSTTKVTLRLEGLAFGIVAGSVLHTGLASAGVSGEPVSRTPPSEPPPASRSLSSVPPPSEPPLPSDDTASLPPPASATLSCVCVFSPALLSCCLLGPLAHPTAQHNNTHHTNMLLLIASSPCLPRPDQAGLPHHTTIHRTTGRLAHRCVQMRLQGVGRSSFAIPLPSLASAPFGCARSLSVRLSFRPFFSIVAREKALLA